MVRKLSKIIALTFLVQIAAFGFGLLNNILLSRWLGPAPLGKVAILFVLAELIYKISNLGLETSTSYFISNQRFPFSQIMGNIVTLIALVLGFSTLLSYFAFRSGLVHLFVQNSGTRTDLPGFGWCVLLIVGYMSYDYGTKIILGRQQFINYNKYQFIRPLLLFSFLLAGYRYLGITIALVIIYYSAAWTVTGFFMWRQAAPIRPRFNPMLVKKLLSYGTKIMLTNLITFLNYRADVFLIGYFGSSEMVGWYYVATVVAEKMNYISQSTNTILFPAAAHSEAQQAKTPIFVRSNLFIVSLIAIVVAIATPSLLPVLYSSQYQNSVLPLLVLLPGVVALTLPKVISADLAARGMPQISMYVTILIFALNIALNILLIPRIGILGAALSSSIAYLTAALLMSYLYKRITGTGYSIFLVPRRSDWRELRKI